MIEDAHATALRKKCSDQVLPDKTAAAGNECLRHAVWSTSAPPSAGQGGGPRGVCLDDFCKIAARSGRKLSAMKSLATIYIGLISI